MTDGAPTVAGDRAAPVPNAADKPPTVPPAAMPQARPEMPPGVGFALRTVPKATAAERLAREVGMARALRLGATPHRDRDRKWRHIPFKDANRPTQDGPTFGRPPWERGTWIT